MTKKRKIKWVKKANMYCHTWFENDKQIQKWISKEDIDSYLQLD